VVLAVAGFAARALGADLFDGLAMAVERPFEIGHWGKLDHGVAGRVTTMTWPAVQLALDPATERAEVLLGSLLRQQTRGLDRPQGGPDGVPLFDPLLPPERRAPWPGRGRWNCRPATIRCARVKPLPRGSSSSRARWRSGSAPLRTATAAVLQEIWRDALAPRLRGNPALADRFAERLADRRLTDARRAGPRTGTADPQERQPGIAALLRRARQWLALAEAAPQGQ
jgi:hypothetical protein